MINEVKRNLNILDYTLINFINLDDSQKNRVLSWRNNSSVREWMYTDHIISPDEHNRFLTGTIDEEINFYWVVIKDEIELGVLSINRVDWKNKNAYLGLYRNPDCKIQDVGKILIKLTQTIVFDLMQFNTLKLEVIEGNRIISIYKRSGFREEGVLREFVYKNDEYVNVIVMGILKKEYESRK